MQLVESFFHWNDYIVGPAILVLNGFHLSAVLRYNNPRWSVYRIFLALNGVVDACFAAISSVAQIGCSGCDGARS